MAERRKRTELRRVADENVEPAIALVDRRGQLVDLDEVAQVEGHQRGAAAGGADLVVDFLKSAWRACRQHQMRALAGKALGDGRADAARRAGDERDFARETPGHHTVEAASAATCVARAERRCMPHSASPLRNAVATR